MRNYIIIVGSIIIVGFLVGILTIGAYRTGEEVSEKVWANTVEVALEHGQLSDLSGCLFAIDSDTMHLVRAFDADAARRLAWRMSRCDDLLEALGQVPQDEETGRVLGEARIFFNGYQETLNDILELQLKLEVLYADFSTDKVEEIGRLELQQNKQLRDAQKFLDRMQSLIIRAW